MKSRSLQLQSSVTRWFMCVLMEQKCILDVAKLKPPPTGNKTSDIVSYEKGLDIETPHITVLRFTVGYIVF